MAAPHTVSKLTAIIVDDELFGRENLKKIIETYCPEIEILACADSVVNARELVRLHPPDVVFLDINMPVLDGFDFLNDYEERNFMTVFVSAHEEFGIKAVKAGAADYLLKPVSIQELKQTVKRLLHLQKKHIDAGIVSETDKLVIPASHGFTVLVTSDILRLEAQGCYTKIVMKNGKTVVISRTLKEFEENLPKEHFFRIHKSHLINMKHIKEYSRAGGNFVTMTDGGRIEISRRKVAAFVQKTKTAMTAV